MNDYGQNVGECGARVNPFPGRTTCHYSFAAPFQMMRHDTALSSWLFHATRLTVLK
jgi:hypothetical protein